MMKITGLSHLFKWENLHNWWLTKYFFAPLYSLRKAIKQAKRQYSDKIAIQRLRHETYVAGSTDNQGLQRENQPRRRYHVLLLDELNTFFASFENKTVPLKLPATKDCGLSFSVADVSKHVHLSISQCAVPTCFKMSTIVHVPKKAKVTELNDYRLLALTSVIVKCFESLGKDHITSILPGTLDPFQLAYCPH